MNKIITISRQYGSGGREIGNKLAEKLGIPFYDNELITLAAQESGFSEVAFERAEEKASNSLLYSLAMGMSSYGNQTVGYAHLSLDERLYLAQSSVIRKVAEEGPCVIVGRCAEYILKNYDNVVDIFIWAGLDSRVKRAVEMYGLAPEKAAETVIKTDKRRANYYNYHAEERWGQADHYDISIRSDIIGIDTSLQLILDYITKIN